MIWDRRHPFLRQKGPLGLYGEFWLSYDVNSIWGRVGGVGRLGGVGPWARDPHLYGSPLGPGPGILTYMGPPWARDPHLYGSPLGPGPGILTYMPPPPGPGILTYMGPPWARARDPHLYGSPLGPGPGSSFI
jgi:hypothetical protein